MRVGSVHVVGRRGRCCVYVPSFTLASFTVNAKTFLCVRFVSLPTRQKAQGWIFLVF